MRLTRRRKRRPDPFSSPAWVRSVLARLKAASPLLSALSEKDLISLARSIRHAQRYQATDTRRGRPPRWPRQEVLTAGSKLAEALGRETRGRVSVATFVDHYLRILDFPADVLGPLSAGEVNLFEAEQLARVSASRLGVSQAEDVDDELLEELLKAAEPVWRVLRKIKSFRGENKSGWEA